MDNMLLKFCNKNPVYTVPHTKKKYNSGKNFKQVHCWIKVKYRNLFYNRQECKEPK